MFHQFLHESGLCGWACYREGTERVHIVVEEGHHHVDQVDQEGKHADEPVHEVVLVEDVGESEFGWT